jgi:phospholipase/carboxylesterase
MSKPRPPPAGLPTRADAQHRDMLVYDLVPCRHSAPASWLCLVLHGLGDSKEGWKPITPELCLEDLDFAFAQAPIPYYGGWSWFDLDGTMRPDDDQVRASRAMLDELVDHLMTTRKIPAERLFIFGFSQGCLMTLDWGLRRRERFAGLIGISGFMTMLDEYPAALGAAALQQRIFLSHGLYDGLIPIAATRRVKDRLLSLGLNVEWHEYAKEHGLDPGNELPDLHAWMATAMSHSPS